MKRLIMFCDACSYRYINVYSSLVLSCLLPCLDDKNVHLVLAKSMSGRLGRHRSGCSVDRSTLSLRSLCASKIILIIIISAVISTQAKAKALLFLIEKPGFQTGMKLSSRVVILSNITDEGKVFLSVSQLLKFFSALCPEKKRCMARFGLSFLVWIC